MSKKGSVFQKHVHSQSGSFAHANVTRGAVFGFACRDGCTPFVEHEDRTVGGAPRSFGCGRKDDYRVRPVLNQTKPTTATTAGFVPATVGPPSVIPTPCAALQILHMGHISLREASGAQPHNGICFTCHANAHLAGIHAQRTRVFLRFSPPEVDVSPTCAPVFRTNTYTCNPWPT